MAKGKRCHGGETEMMPRQHPGSSNSIEMLVQRNKCGCTKRARVTGSDPGYGVSHMSVAWLMANVQGTIRTRSKHRVHLIQQKHSVHGRRLGVIPSKHAFSERVKFDEESSGTRAIVEVVVLATVEEVVVHGCRGSSRSRRW